MGPFTFQGVYERVVGTDILLQKRASDQERNDQERNDQGAKDQERKDQGRNDQERNDQERNDKGDDQKNKHTNDQDKKDSLLLPKDLGKSPYLIMAGIHQPNWT